MSVIMESYKMIVRKGLLKDESVHLEDQAMAALANAQISGAKPKLSNPADPLRVSTAEVPGIMPQVQDPLVSSGGCC